MFCRDCYYNLRGLTQPRCPECGAEFNPADPSTWLASLPTHRSRLLEWASLVCVSIPFLAVAGVHLQLVAARLVLGRWPNRWGADDPKFIDGLGLFHVANGILMLLSLPAILLMPGLFGAMIGRRAWGSIWRIAACLVILWAAAATVVRLDPAQAFLWWMD